MEKTEIILLTAVLLFVSIRIYQKYFRKDSKTAGSPKPGGIDGSTTKEDDYEPYSRK